MKKKPRVSKPKPFLAALSACSGPSLIKHLASCNSSVRNQTLRLIESWLQESKASLEEEEMLKLWKGFFYCLWHSDKADAQGSLINRLCSFLVSLDPVLSLQYFSVCLVTLRREWTGIDRLRLDKFYLFIRRFMNAVFASMRNSGWDLEHVGRFVGVLEENGLLATDGLQGNGVNYHVASVYLDELKGFRVPLARKEVVECLFRPFFGVLGKSLDKILVGKVKSCVFDALLDQGKALLMREINGNEGSESDLLGIISLKMGFSERLYELGSSPGCVQGNRKVILGLHEEFSKLEKHMEASGVNIEIPEFMEEVENDGEEEVPQLIPLLNEVSVMEPVDKGSLKKKKEKKKKKKEKKDNEVAGDENTEKSEEKKKKKKKKKKARNGVEENGDAVVANDSGSTLENGTIGSSNGRSTEDDDSILDLSESVMSSLQAEFEKVAAEDDDMKSGSSELPLVAVKKKRKRAKSADVAQDSEADVQGAQSSSKSAKKVKFAMKNNLVWKPHTPMPPQEVRIPPSVTPRGSALKKGVPPGPIREMVPASKKAARKRKGRKIMRTASPAVKRLKKVKVHSV